jgi:hypothetical protein
MICSGAGTNPKPFRLSWARDESAAFDEAIGFRLEYVELALSCARLLPGLTESPVLPFSEDGLVRLQVERATDYHNVPRAVAVGIASRNSVNA